MELKIEFKEFDYNYLKSMKRMKRYIRERNRERNLLVGSCILSLALFADLLYKKLVSNRVSKLQGQLDDLYKNINSEKNKKDDKLLDRK